MLLVIDVGNTQTVLGVFDGEELRHHFRVQTSRERTADEYQVVLFNLFQMAGVGADAVRSCMMASVVPAMNEVFCEAVVRAFGVQTQVVGPGIKSGMPILCDNPREVGADRIVNAVAAFEEFGGPLIVVDFGTATTFDCVSAKGEYLGGAIAPGVSISANALFARAAKLPRAEIQRPPQAIGRNTVHSMQSGIVFGYVSLVDGLVARLESEIGEECQVIGTGGLASLIQQESETLERVEPYLTLKGLRILHTRNSG